MPKILREPALAQATSGSPPGPQLSRVLAVLRSRGAITALQRCQRPARSDPAVRPPARKLAADEIRRYMRGVFRSELMALCEYGALADPVDRGTYARGQQGTRRDDCHAGKAAPALVGEPIQSHAANF